MRHSNVLENQRSKLRTNLFEKITEKNFFFLKIKLMLLKTFFEKDFAKCGNFAERFKKVPFTLINQRLKR